MYKIHNTEKQQAAKLESMEEAATLTKNQKRLEELEYDTTLLQYANEIDTRADLLLDRFETVYGELRRVEVETHQAWRTIRFVLLEKRKTELRRSEDALLFRGVNPDLAKVLAGLLGQRGGVRLDPSTGEWVPTPMYDPTVPFGDMPVLSKNDGKSKNGSNLPRAKTNGKQYMVDRLMSGAPATPDSPTAGAATTGADGDMTARSTTSRAESVRGPFGLNRSATNTSTARGTAGLLTRALTAMRASESVHGGAGGASMSSPRALSSAMNGGAGAAAGGDLVRSGSLMLPRVPTMLRMQSAHDLTAMLASGAAGSNGDRMAAFGSEHAGHVQSAGLQSLMVGLGEAQSVQQAELFTVVQQQQAEIEQRSDLDDQQKQQLSQELIARSQALSEVLALEAHAQVATAAALLKADDDAQQAMRETIEKSAGELAAQMERIRRMEEEQRMEEERQQQEQEELDRQIEAEQRAVLAGQVDVDSDPSERGGLLEEHDVRLLQTLRHQVNPAAAEQQMLKMRERVRQQRQQQRQNAVAKDEEREKQRQHALESERAKAAQLKKRLAAEQKLAEVTDRLQRAATIASSEQQDLDQVEAALTASGSAADGKGDQTKSGSIAELRQIRDKVRAVEQTLVVEEQSEVSALEAEQKAQELELQQQLNETMAREKDRLRQQRDERKKQLEAMRLSQENSQEEAANILEEHDHEVERLETQMDGERLRQMQALQEKVNKRKEAQRAAAQKKREAVLKSELSREKEIKQQMLAQQELAAVKEAMAAYEEKEQRAVAKSVVERVLQPRCQKETTDLLRAQYEERANALKKELMREDADLAEVEARLAETLDKQHAKAHNDLQRVHYERIKAAYRELYPDENFKGDQWTDAEALVDLGAYQKARERRLLAEEEKVQTELKQLKEEETRKKADQWKRLEQEMADMEVC